MAAPASGRAPEVARGMNPIDSAMSTLDATKVKPFNVLDDYYLRYSTCLAAVWTPGVIALLVLTGGADFISWVVIGSTEDVALLAHLLGNASAAPYALPPVALNFYPLQTPCDYGGVLSDEPFFNTSFLNISYRTCTREFSFSTAGVITNLSTTCSALTAVGSEAGAECRGAQRTASVRGYCLFDTVVEVSGSPIHDWSTYVELHVSTCSDGSCASAAEIAAKLDGGTLFVSLATDVPTQLKEDFEEVPHESHMAVPIHTDTYSSPTIVVEPQLVEDLPSYLSTSDIYEFASLHELMPATSPRPEASRVATIRFELDERVRRLRFLPVTFLDLLAQIGSTVAAVYVVNFFIARFNFMTFFARADSSWFVPNVLTRQYLFKNRQLDQNKYEHRLMYTLTFGGVDRWGLQTKHVYDFFVNKDHRFDGAQTTAIVNDIRKVLMERRIGPFTIEAAKEDRKDDGEYDVTTVKSTNVRSELKKKLRYGEHLMSKLQDDDGGYNPEEDHTIREFLTTEKLHILHDELQKICFIGAHVFPEYTKSYNLAHKLKGTTFKPPKAKFD